MPDVIIDLEVVDEAALVLEVVNYDGVGPAGLSAYQISLANGTFIGTELEWAESLAKISVGTLQPPNPVVNQLWADTNPIP